MATQNVMPKFNLSEIPDNSRLVLLSIIHREAIEYLKQPGIDEKFERWKADREKKTCRKEAQYER